MCENKRPKDFKNNHEIQINESDYENILQNNLYCPSCFMYPEYTVFVNLNKDILLNHACINGKLVQKPLSFEIKEIKGPFSYKNCVNCQNNSTKKCLRCNIFMCDNCAINHDIEPYNKNDKFFIYNDERTSVQNILDCEYICKEHYYHYEYYCPVCRLNLCKECKIEHFHCKCPKLSDKKFIYEKKEEILDNPFMNKLINISKIFLYCYENGKNKAKLTLNILLNANLAENIISCAEKNIKSVDKIGEIKNDFLNQVNESLYLCEKYGDTEFKIIYSKLISDISSGNIRRYYILQNIKRKYKNIDQTCSYDIDDKIHSSISTKISFNKNDYMLSQVLCELNKTKYECCKLLKIVSNLNLKLKLNFFMIKLLKMTTLQMNKKLNFEVRRKIGNLLGSNILDKFKENIEQIEPSIKIICSSAEKIK